ncbi:MAG: GatB/YqeY domain-containing protein [Bacilli bacterium]|nr:GatB/YqeY domain-containing protein [Bacilli bacterium]
MIQKIDEDLKLALKNQDKFTLSVLRLLKSEFINESRKGTLHELSDDEAIKVIKRQVKTRKDSIAEYTSYGKTELAKELEHEVEILSQYLPAEMSEEEILKVIDAVFEELKPTSMKDMGSIMKSVSSKLTNADMAFVSKTIKDRLN